jgi:O-antigen/teichoic acid export membrane protein
MLKKNLIFNSLLSVSQFIFPLITFPYSSRILGPAGIGSVNIIDRFTQYFLLFSALGIPLYGVREIARRKNDHEERNKIFNEIITIHIICTCLFAAIYITAAFFIPVLKSHFHLVLLGIVIMFSNIFMIEWFFQGIEQFRFLTIRSLTVRVLSIVFLFVFLRPGSSPVMYYGITAASYAINASLNIVFLRKHAKLGLVTSGFRQHIKPLTIILGSSLAVSVYVLMDNIILGFFKGEIAVGIYSTSVRIVKIPFAIIVAISTVIIPQVSRAFSENNEEEAKQLIHKSFTLICLTCIPVSIGMFLSSGFLVQSFAGPKFVAASIPLEILSPIIMLVALNNIFGFQVLTPLGKEKLLLRAVVIGMVFSISANLFVIPLLSYTGAALVNLLTEVIVTIACYVYMRRYSKVALDVKVFLQCLAGALLFIPVAFLVKDINASYIIQQISLIVICVVIYVVYVWFFVRNVYLENFKVEVLKKIGLSMH